MHWYLEGLRRYATFSGRASREEFWQYQGVALIGLLVMSGLTFTVPWLGSLLANVFLAATVVPSLAVAVRRLHDTGRSGAILGLVVFLDFSQYGTWLVVAYTQGQALWAWGLAIANTIGGYLLSLLLFGLLCLASEPGANRYGAAAPHRPGGR